MCLGLIPYFCDRFIVISFSQINFVSLNFVSLQSLVQNHLGHVAARTYIKQKLNKTLLKNVYIE